MKKIVALLLAAVLVLSLCACTPSGNTDDGITGAAGDTTVAGSDTTGQLLVGFGRADITPKEYSVPVAAVGNTERYMSQGFKSFIYQIAVAITDPNGNTAILIASDAGSFHTYQTDEMSKRIETEIGVPAKNIIICALHQHSCPDTRNSKVPTSDQYYKEILIPGAVEAAKLAMENRAVTTAVQSTSLETENMNFVRHYIMADGTYAGANFGDLKASTPVKHTADPDAQLQMIKFVREGQTTMDGKGAKNIILTNFQGHLTWGMNTGTPTIHADSAGIYREALEKELDCHAIYFSGAGGNMAFNSEIKEENKASDYKDYGEKLARIAIKAQDTFADVSFADIKISTVTYTGKCNHDEDDRYEEAKKLQEEFNKNFDTSIFKKNGFESQHHVNAIVSHKSLPETRDMVLTAIAMGDVAFIAAPYEMFSDSGERIKEGSPFKNTIVTTIANGGYGYMPTTEAWEYGCYEQYSSNYVKGTAELLETEFINMLTDLHGQY